MSGWNAALISRLVGLSGSVVTAEIIQELATEAAGRLNQLGYGNVKVIQGYGSDGDPSATFDRAMFTAGAFDFPQALFVGEEVFKRMTIVTPCDHVKDEDEPVVAYLCRATTLSGYVRDPTPEKESAALAQADKDIGYLLREYDASVLYRKWYLGGHSAFGVNLPCSTIRTGPPDVLTAGPASCPLYWDEDRCQSALQKLSTWDVDFEWTESQHAIGAKFGAEQCKGLSLPTAEAPDKAFCRALATADAAQSTKKPVHSIGDPASAH